MDQEEHRTRILLTIENYLLRRQRNIIQALACTLTCSSGRGVDPEAQKYKISLLLSELETLKSFQAKLNSSTSLFPVDVAAAAAASSSAWIYAAIVMSSLAVEEVVTFARIVTPPLWTSQERLNIDDYYSRFFPWYARNVPGFVHEASRASAIIHCDASSLVAKLMNPVIWQNFFPSTIAEAFIEFQHQEFQLINVAFMPQVSPLTQTRNVKLLRCSKRIEDDTWVVADISVYFSSYARGLVPEFMRFPSGFLVQQITDFASRVTIVDHWVYKKEEQVNDLNPNLGFGAQKTLAGLERQFYDLGLSSISTTDNNLRKLSSLMVYKFCTGVCGHMWERFVSPVNNITMFSRTKLDMNGDPYVLFSATGLAKMQASEEVIFGLTKRAEKKDIWKYLEHFEDMNELIRIERNQNPKNEISVFIMKRTGSRDCCLIEETYFGASGTMIIHACVNLLSLKIVLNGGDLSRIAFSPCGITIMHCGQQECVVSAGCQAVASQAMGRNSDEVVNHVKNVVTDSLRNVQNLLP